MVSGFTRASQLKSSVLCVDNHVFKSFGNWVVSDNDYKPDEHSGYGVQQIHPFHNNGGAWTADHKIYYVPIHCKGRMRS